LSIFEALRVLDDRDELRTPRFTETELPMWPFVRWLACSAVLDKVLGLQQPFAPTRRTLRQTAGLVTRAALHGPLSAGQFDIVIVGSSVGLSVQREGRWFGRIDDYFAMEYPDRTLVLDLAAADGYKTPRFPPNVRCYDTFDFRAGFAARLRRPRDADLAAIDGLVAFLRRGLPVPVENPVLERVRSQLVHFAVRLPMLERSWARFFDVVRPRVMLFEDGSYGGFAHVLHWSHRAGVATGEIQHGVISSSHVAYNYGAFAADCLPQHLLVYGEFWKRQINMPSSPVVIGCPHFSETARVRAGGESILAISQGIRTQAIVELTAAVARRFPDRRCVFRVHPGELAFPERYASLAGIANVEISDRGDIYQLLEAARVVIGHSSMALTEAAGMGLPVLVLDDETSRVNVPQGVGTRFATVEELLPLVEAPPAGTTDPGWFFAPDWRARYRSFIEAI
jgi:hypothetical protein